MMIKKSFVTSLCLLSLALVPNISFSNPSYITSDSVEMVGEKNQKVHVKITDNVKGSITEEHIESILEQAGDAEEITIHKIHYKESPEKRTESKNALENKERASILSSYYYSYPVKNVKSTDNPTTAVQIISVPKGKTIKLTSSQAKKISNQTRVQASVTAGGGSVPSSVTEEVEGTLTSEISTTYTKEETWTGPSENSKYVSRIYYWTGFYDTGKWTVNKIDNKTKKVLATYQGDYKEPTYDVEWSRDIK